MTQALAAPKQLWHLLKDAARQWSEDKTFRLGAALAYYAVFSLAPLLLIVISTAGLIFGEAAARGEVVQQLEAAAGKVVAQALEETLRYVHVTESGTLATIIGLVIVFVSSTGLFVQLQDSLNTIWDVQARRDRTWKDAIVERLLTFLMVLLCGSLLFGLMLLNSFLDSIDRFLPAESIPGAVYFWRAFDWAITLGLMTLLIALVFKVLPDVKLKWKDVWIGAAVTSVLLLFGNYLISFYLSWSGLASVYGAAGSLIVVMMWVYYSSQVFLFGAELTHSYATRDGGCPPPKANAEKLKPEERASQGMRPKEKVSSGEQVAATR